MLSRDRTRLSLGLGLWLQPALCHSPDASVQLPRHRLLPSPSHVHFFSFILSFFLLLSVAHLSLLSFFRTRRIACAVHRHPSGREDQFASHTPLWLLASSPSASGCDEGSARLGAALLPRRCTFFSPLAHIFFFLCPFAHRRDRHRTCMRTRRSHCQRSASNMPPLPRPLPWATCELAIEPLSSFLRAKLCTSVNSFRLEHKHLPS